MRSVLMLAVGVCPCVLSKCSLCAASSAEVAVVLMAVVEGSDLVDEQDFT